MQIKAWPAFVPGGLTVPHPLGHPSSANCLQATAHHHLQVHIHSLFHPLGTNVLSQDDEGGLGTREKLRALRCRRLRHTLQRNLAARRMAPESSVSHSR